MNRFVCLQCGRFCYSAAAASTMTDDRCPYTGCHGHVIPEDGRSVTDESHDGGQDHGERETFGARQGHAGLPDLHGLPQQSRNEGLPGHKD